MRGRYQLGSRSVLSDRQAPVEVPSLPYERRKTAALRTRSEMERTGSWSAAAVESATTRRPDFWREIPIAFITDS